MLNALSIFLPDGDNASHARAVRSFTRQGFAPAETIEWEGGRLDCWEHPAQKRIENCSLQTPVGNTCCVGPLWFRGLFGAPALAALLDEVRATARLDESTLRGNFALFLSTGDHVWLLNDGLGFVRIYASADGCFFSTSWLAVCTYLEHVELDEASAIEYVLLGAAHSRQSVARAVSLLPLGHAWDLKNRRTWRRFPSGIGSAAPDYGSQNEAVEAVAAHLRKVSAEVASAFPGRINAALSGGFDSRLIVAGLLAAGVNPKLFVYGGTNSSDVAIARTVADATGLSLDVINKGVINAGLPPPDLEALEQNALFFDGLPNDGIFDPGADRQTRLQQNADGAIALNGGGGEIFRNFFHLPDRHFTAHEIVRTFYRGFSARIFRSAAGLSDYEERLASSILEILGHPAGSQRLTRSEVELIYPLFRCHYWMGVNNSVAVRHGYYATPLVDPESVRLTNHLPLHWKNAGTFESRLIAALHPGIASQPSGYGFSFQSGPDWKTRLAERLVNARPVHLRPLINAARRRLRHMRVAPETIQRHRALLPGEWCVDALLDLRELPDDNALGRAFAVEIAWRRLL